MLYIITLTRILTKSYIYSSYKLRKILDLNKVVKIEKKNQKG